VAATLTTPKSPAVGPAAGGGKADRSGSESPPLLAHWPAGPSGPSAAAADGPHSKPASGAAAGPQPEDATRMLAVVDNPIFCSSPERGVGADQQSDASSIRPPGSPCDTVSSFGNAGRDSQGEGTQNSDTDSNSEMESLGSDSDSEDGDYRGGSWKNQRAVGVPSASSGASAARFGTGSAFGTGEHTA
jgi:hypothetical protein